MEEENISNLLLIVLSKWKYIRDSDKQWLQFCFECNKVTSYAEKDTCVKCGIKYMPAKSNEKCPECGSDDCISHCEKCDAQLDASYLDDLLKDNDFEWSENELKSILNFLNSLKFPNHKNIDMKQKTSKLSQFKQWILSIIIGCLFPKLAYVLDKLLNDSKNWAEDWGRDYNEYDYIKIAKRYRQMLK